MSSLAYMDDFFQAVGFPYRNLSPQIMFQQDAKITLKEEPDNPHDPNAIAVILNGDLVAYVRREDCARVKAFLNSHQETQVKPVVLFERSVKCRLFSATQPTTE